MKSKILKFSHIRIIEPEQIQRNTKNWGEGRDVNTKSAYGHTTIATKIFNKLSKIITKRKHLS